MGVSVWGDWQTMWFGYMLIGNFASLCVIPNIP